MKTRISKEHGESSEPILYFFTDDLTRYGEIEFYWDNTITLLLCDTKSKGDDFIEEYPLTAENISDALDHIKEFLEEQE